MHVTWSSSPVTNFSIPGSCMVTRCGVLLVLLVDLGQHLICVVLHLVLCSRCEICNHFACSHVVTSIHWSRPLTSYICLQFWSWMKRASSSPFTPNKISNFVLVADCAQVRALFPPEANAWVSTWFFFWLGWSQWEWSHISSHLILVTLMVLTLLLALLHTRTTRLFTLSWALAVIAIISAIMLTRREGMRTCMHGHMPGCGYKDESTVDAVGLQLT